MTNGLGSIIYIIGSEWGPQTTASETRAHRRI